MFDLDKKHVLHALPPVLNQIAYNPKYTEAACQILWELGRDDNRPLNSNPDHAVRILCDLAKYEPGKPILYNEKVLNVCERWLDDPKLGEYVNSPLAVIDSLLAKQAEFSRVVGHAWQLGTVPLKAEAIRQLRARALACVEKCLMDSNPRVAKWGLESLHEVMRPLMAVFGRQISEEEQRQWEPERMEAARLLEGFVRSSSSPALLAHAASEFGWLAENVKPVELAGAVRKALDLIPNSIEVKLATALTRGLFEIARGDVENYERRQQEFLMSVTKEFLAAFRGDAAISKLEEVVGDIKQAGIDSSHGQLLYIIANENPTLGFAIVEHVMGHEECLLSGYTPPMLHGLWQQERAKVDQLIHRVINEGRSELKASIAFAYAHSDWSVEAREEDFRALEVLLSSGGSGTKYHVMQALRRLQEDPRHQSPRAQAGEDRRSLCRRGISLLLAVDIGEDANLAEGLCEALDPKFGISPDLISEDEARTLLWKFVPIPDIGHRAYHLGQVLGYFASRSPALLLDFLMARVDYGVAHQDEHASYSAIPFGLDGLFAATEGTSLQLGLLRRVRDELSDSEGLRAYWVSQVFKLVAGGFGDATVQIILELEQGGKEAHYRVIASLLNEAPGGFVFNKKSICADVLERAWKVSEKSYRMVASALAGAAESGTFTSAPGQPCPKYVAIRQNANSSADEFRDRPLVATFYREMAARAQNMIDTMLERDEEGYVE